MRTTPEILAPAGGQEQLEAAVRCGADAVYLGSGGFNARRNAQNFGDGGLARAVSYCHGRGVEVHVTLNTLVTDAERPELIKEIENIARSGADAVLIQDLGVAALVRECCPGLAMHASTQLSVHNVAGAELMRRLGFERVVLARELDSREIAAIKAESGLELEIFVHGALCMSMSGSCYMSAMLGGRSGNRGLCAQPCRLNFETGGRQYALSLKDVSLISRMEELRELGLNSLKIEGRMKRPEYVAAAVVACRQALEGRQPDMERLRAVFSRGGFTDGYFTGRRGLDMFGYRSHEDVTAAAGVLGELKQLYRTEVQRIPLSMQLRAWLQSPVTLKASDGEHCVEVSGGLPQQAQNRPTDEELVRRGLQKLGGTPFYLDELKTELDGQAMVPVSEINALRKEAAERLLSLREEPRPHSFAPPLPRSGPPASSAAEPRRLYLRLENAEQLTENVRSAADLIILPAEVAYSQREKLHGLESRLAVELPSLVFPGDEQNTAEQLKKLCREGIRIAVAETQGSMMLARESGMLVMGGFGLNILNSDALDVYAGLGLCEVTLSIEGSMRAARAMAAASPLPLGVVGYGYLPVMTFRNCPVGDCKSCKQNATVTDRRGIANRLLCRGRQYTQLLNSVPLYLGDRQEVLDGLDFVTLYFTVETPAETDALLQRWRSGAPYPGERTGGLYFRELQ